MNKATAEKERYERGRLVTAVTPHQAAVALVGAARIVGLQPLAVFGSDWGDERRARQLAGAALSRARLASPKALARMLRLSSAIVLAPSTLKAQGVAETDIARVVRLVQAANPTPAKAEPIAPAPPRQDAPAAVQAPRAAEPLARPRPDPAPAVLSRAVITRPPLAAPAARPAAQTVITSLEARILDELERCSLRVPSLASILDVKEIHVGGAVRELQRQGRIAAPPADERGERERCWALVRA